jgi:predicted Zn-dependent protease
MKNKGKTILLNKVSLTWLLVWVLSVSAFGYSSQYTDETKSIKIRWKSNAIKIGISSSMTKPSTNFKSDTDVAGAIKRSLEHWESVANIQFIEVSTDKQTVTQKGTASDGVNLITIAATPENLLLFSDNPTEISARTRTFFNRKGFITEADIVLNPYQQFSTDGTFGTFDLESTITHEIGHLLGLEHSFVIGSTMQANQAKNGIYGMPSFISRSLAEDDITAVRGLYGSKNDENCCGSISGKVATKDILYLWLQDLESGSISVGFNSKSDGSFRVDGLSAGKYRLLAQNKRLNSSVTSLSEIVIEKGKTLIFENQPKFNNKSFEVSHIGFNAQLTNVAVPINAGKTYLIYIGGENLNTKDYAISFDSPYIKINRQSLISQDFGDAASVLSFEIEVNSAAPTGDYAVKIRKFNGETDYLIGGLSIDGNFVNNWNNKLLTVGEE